jgi:trimethylamine corrinoid protein
MNQSNVLMGQLKQAVIKYDEKKSKALAKNILASGIDPLWAINNGLNPAMQIVGEKFKKLEYFLPQLILAADSMNAAMQVFTPQLFKNNKQIKSQGKIVLGTVCGDIHEIGKNIAGLLFKINGFEVIDLGKDVPIMDFINKAEEVKADIIGVSALMSTTMPGQKDLIDLLKEMGLRKKYLVAIGGGPTTNVWAGQIGADVWSNTADQSIEKIKRILKQRKGMV